MLSEFLGAPAALRIPVHPQELHRCCSGHLQAISIAKPTCVPGFSYVCTSWLGDITPSNLLAVVAVDILVVHSHTGSTSRWSMHLSRKGSQACRRKCTANHDGRKLQPPNVGLACRSRKRPFDIHGRHPRPTLRLKIETLHGAEWILSHAAGIIERQERQKEYGKHRGPGPDVSTVWRLRLARCRGQQLAGASEGDPGHVYYQILSL